MAPRHEEPAPARPTPISRLSHASKHSVRSNSSSFEADDERSSTASAEASGRMTPGRRSISSASSDGRSSIDSHRLRINPNGGSSRYPGEDTRPTSGKELAGWYAYAFAAEVYVVCGEFSPFGRHTFELPTLTAGTQPSVYCTSRVFCSLHCRLTIRRIFHPHPSRESSPREWCLAFRPKVAVRIKLR